MALSELLDILCCPDSGEHLQLTDTGLASSAVDYPVVDKNLACLYSNPSVTRFQWGSKIKHFFDSEREHLKQMQQLAQTCSLASTRKRISLQHEARHKNLALMQKMLSAWIPDKALPVAQSSQQIYSYFELLFRDWCWGDELRPYIDYCVSALGAQHCERVLVLGSGAGGLSYHLANALAQSRLISIEHNPFLALASHHIMQGKLLKIHDYSLYPTELAGSSTKWEIKQAPLQHENHVQLLATYPKLPLLEKSVDAIIAPWFFDILDIPFDAALQACTRFLKPKGKLVFMGPANVHKPHYDEQYCSDEIRELLCQQFATVDLTQQSLTYLDNPTASQRRLESVAFAVAAEPIYSEYSRETSMPKDLVYTPELNQYKLKTATIHQILACIDQSISVNELADLLVSRFGFEAHESSHYAAAFIAEIQSGIKQG